MSKWQNAFMVLLILSQIVLVIRDFGRGTRGLSERLETMEQHVHKLEAQLGILMSIRRDQLAEVAEHAANHPRINP